MANPDLLKKVLLYHVIPAEVKSSAITGDDTLVDSAEGSKLRVNVYMKKFYYDVSNALLKGCVILTLTFSKTNPLYSFDLY